MKKLDKKRKLQRKTNYSKRLKLIKGGALRLIVRKTNQYLIIQIVKSESAQDKILYSVNTKELLNHKWPETNKGSLKSLPASYLGGFLLGKKAKNLKELIILDLGLHPNTKGSRIYAVIKGISDSGLRINFNENIIPDEKRLKGSKLEIFDKVKGEIENA